MKKVVFSLMTAAVCIGFTACNSDSNTTAGSDSTSKSTTTETSTATTTNSSTTDYAAMADEFDRNSAAGNYRDVRTGKPVKISVDRSTGQKMNADTREPITRYIWVDNNDWWVYDAEGTKLSRAKMENDKLMFEDNNTWVDYDVKWKNDGDLKIKGEDGKIKVDKDGEMKIKTDDKKIKADKDTVKIKDN